MTLFPLSIPILLLFLAASTYVFWQLVPTNEKGEVQARLGLSGVEAQRGSPLVRGLRPLFALLLPFTKVIRAEDYRARVDRKFVSAGMAGTMNSDEFIAYKMLMSVLFWVLFAGLFARGIVGWHLPLLVDVAILIGGSYFPDAWLDGQMRDRQDAIRRALPYVMDLLTLSVEAGLDFVAGINKVCEKARSGPLVDELAFFLGEIQLGATRQQALRNLAARIDMPEVRSFSAMLIQADLLGASVGPVLRAQSDLIRTQRFQAAERQGAYAAQKILFPLILCIMPAVFVVIFGPIILNFVYGDQVIGL